MTRFEIPTSTRSIRVSLGVLTVAATLSACGSPEEPRSVDEVQVAGELPPTRILHTAVADLPEWQTRLLYSSADFEGFVLADVSDAALTSDGGVVIADPRSAQLLRVNGDGRVAAIIGRQGEGPGEYHFIQSVSAGSSGEVFAFDRSLQRLTVLEPGRDSVETYRLDFNGLYLPYSPLIRLNDGSFISVLEFKPQLGKGVHRPPIFLIHHDVSRVEIDTLGIWPGVERYDDPAMRLMYLPVGYSRGSLFAGNGQYVAMALTDSLDVTLFRGLNPLIRVVAEYEPNPAPLDAEGWIERRVIRAEYPTDDLRVRWRERLAPTRVNQTLPNLGGLGVDENGRLWVGNYALPEDIHRTWMVVAPNSEPLARVELPAYWAPESTITIAGFPTHELLDVSSDRVAILRKDSLDVLHVDVLEILRH